MVKAAFVFLTFKSCPEFKSTRRDSYATLINRLLAIPDIPNFIEFGEIKLALSEVEELFISTKP